MYELMENNKFDSFEEFVIKKAFAESHYNDSCFDEFRNLTLGQIWELADNGNYLAKVFTVVMWFCFL